MLGCWCRCVRASSRLTERLTKMTTDARPCVHDALHHVRLEHPVPRPRTPRSRSAAHRGHTPMHTVVTRCTPWSRSDCTPAWTSHVGVNTGVQPRSKLLTAHGCTPWSNSQNTGAQPSKEGKSLKRGFRSRTFGLSLASSGRLSSYYSCPERPVSTGHAVGGCWPSVPGSA
eukprot:3261629-Rhodomonas_salina.2